MGDKRFRAVLFYVFVVIFCVTAVIALLSVFIKLPGLDEPMRNRLFGGLILEVAASIIAFWKQLSGGGFSDPPSVSGDWEYECIRDDETYKHGGTCRIEVRKAPFGWEFTINGMRTWTAINQNGQWTRKSMEATAAWENTWGTFTGLDALRYAYSIKAGGNLVQGYGWASIKKDAAGTPNLMEGNFSNFPHTIRSMVFNATGAHDSVLFYRILRTDPPLLYRTMPGAGCPTFATASSSLRWVSARHVLFPIASNSKV